MKVHQHNLLHKLAAIALSTLFLTPSFHAQEPNYTFKATTELVLVNVTARDKDGNLVRDLKLDDFTLLEDNKPQHTLTFDIENTDAVPPADVPQASLLSAPTAPAPPKAAVPQPASPGTPAFKDRRLIILFFDLTSMQPDEIERAATAAQNYVDKQMTPADLVAVLSLGTSLAVNQDFSSDREQLKKILQAFNATSGSGFESGSTGTTEGTADTGQAFTVDDTEYNIFNTDRRLEALRSIAAKLAKVEQKKSLIYFSSGMDRTGTENQAQLRAAINASVRANLSIYPLDIRGLQAMVPGGEAQSASLRGTAAYSGRATLNQYDSNFSSQETLVTLAGDTGGRAFLDSNDFGRVFRGVQDDTATYYLLGYRSNNAARDGRFRRITVRVNRPGLKLEFRKGYYAPADFQHSTREDREQQLEDELASELPSTDFPVYLSTAYFRLGEGRFYVPVSLAVPGSEIPFTSSGDKDKATLDVIGVITDENTRPIFPLRDTVKLAVNQTAEVRRKNVQYNTSLFLPPGKYHLKIVVRENQTGRMGSFETDTVIPDLKSAPLKVSSIVLASQLQPATKRGGDSPLVRDGSELIPNVTHVFASGQQLYFYYEVYDPARERSDNTRTATNGGVHLLSNVAFFRGKSKAYETPLAETRELGVPGRHAAVFQLSVPLADLKPGFYTCQVNIFDDTAGRFAFPRVALLVRQ